MDTPTTDAFIDKLIAEGEARQSARSVQAWEIVNGQNLQSLEDAKRFAAAWITALEYACAADEYRQRCEDVA